MLNYMFRYVFLFVMSFFVHMSGYSEQNETNRQTDYETVKMMEHPMKISRNMIHVNDIDLFYMDTKTEGPVILCIHGLWGRAETWVDFMQHYGSKYRVIALDVRGHGLSSQPISTYSGEEMAQDMAMLLKALHIDSCVVVGHSMGAYVAGYFSAKYPQYVGALALLDKTAAGPNSINPLPPDKIPVVDPLTKDWPLPFSSLKQAQDFLKMEMESDLSYQYFMNSLVEKEDGFHMMFSEQAVAAYIAYYESWFHILPDIHCPVMLMRSSSHEAVSDEDFAKMQSMLPNCVMAVESSDPDHNVQLSNKQQFYEYFDAFLMKSQF